jgi:hypothetical protein
MTRVQDILFFRSWLRQECSKGAKTVGEGKWVVVNILARDYDERHNSVPRPSLYLRISVICHQPRNGPRLVLFIESWLWLE